MTISRGGGAKGLSGKATKKRTLFCGFSKHIKTGQVIAQTLYSNSQLDPRIWYYTTRQDKHGRVFLVYFMVKRNLSSAITTRTDKHGGVFLISCKK